MLVYSTSVLLPTSYYSYEYASYEVFFFGYRR